MTHEIHDEIVGFELRDYDPTVVLIGCSVDDWLINVKKELSQRLLTELEHKVPPHAYELTWEVWPTLYGPMGICVILTPTGDPYQIAEMLPRLERSAYQPETRPSHDLIIKPTTVQDSEAALAEIVSLQTSFLRDRCRIQVLGLPSDVTMEYTYVPRDITGTETALTLSEYIAGSPTRVQCMSTPGEYNLQFHRDDWNFVLLNLSHVKSNISSCLKSWECAHLLLLPVVTNRDVENLCTLQPPSEVLTANMSPPQMTPAEIIQQLSFLRDQAEGTLTGLSGTENCAFRERLATALANFPTQGERPLTRDDLRVICGRAVEEGLRVTTTRMQSVLAIAEGVNRAHSRSLSTNKENQVLATDPASVTTKMIQEALRAALHSNGLFVHFSDTDQVSATPHPSSLWIQEWIKQLEQKIDANTAAIELTFPPHSEVLRPVCPRTLGDMVQGIHSNIALMERTVRESLAATTTLQEGITRDITFAQTEELLD